MTQAKYGGNSAPAILGALQNDVTVPGNASRWPSANADRVALWRAGGSIAVTIDLAFHRLTL